MLTNVIRIHLTAMTLCLLAFGAIFYLLGPLVPKVNLWISALLAGGFLQAWIVMFLCRLRRAPDPKMRMTVQWLGHGAVLPGMALMLPYAEEAVQLVAVICLLGPIATAALSTVRATSAHRRLSLLPYVLPTAVAVFFAFEGGRFAPIVIGAMLGVGLLIHFLRRELQRILNELAEAKESADAARDIRTRLFASASHDLRQPIQSAGLFLDQTLRSRDPALRAEAGQNARVALEAVERHLRQMLDHIQLEAEALVPRPDTLDLRTLLSGLALQFRPLASLEGTQLRVVGSHLCAWADPALAARALSNLIDNALRHANARRVVVGARCCNGSIRLYVIDDGEGVGEAELSRLFDAFAQGDTRGRERGGFGLGLTSARQLARLMDGDVKLDARWTHGSAFFLELPSCQGVAPSQARRSDAQLPGLRRPRDGAIRAWRSSENRVA